MGDPDGPDVPTDGGAIYVVTAFAEGHCGERTRAFANAAAFTRANALFERLTADPAVDEVWLTRADPGGGATFVARRGRPRRGAAMVDIGFDADPVEYPDDE